MKTRDAELGFDVDGETVAATVVTPGTLNPGILFVHGWGGNQDQYLSRARRIAELGCVCLTFNLRGHGETSDRQTSVTREDGLRDVLAAYDLLCGQPGVDPSAIAIVGSSYGGYLAAVVTALRPVRWLALRVPALYKDEDWSLPKVELRKYGLAAFRRGPVRPSTNRALKACLAFGGDVLIVESEHDDTIPHPVIANYMASFGGARSVTYRVIEGADHGLTHGSAQQAYSTLLIGWMTEMVQGARRAPETVDTAGV